MRISRLPLFLALLPLGANLIACGDDTTPPTDSGMADTGMEDATVEDTSRPPPLPDVCVSPIAVTGEIGTSTVSGDTSMVEARPRDLGGDCGNTSAARFAPQEVIAYTVPGTGELGVAFTLDTAGTDENFAAVVQVRGACDEIPGAGTCYGAEENQPGIPARGGVLANGGDVIYFIVTGWAEAMTPATGSGAWQMDITAGPNEAPTLVSGQLSNVGGSLEVALSTMDDTGVETYRMELQGADGMGIDVNEDGMVNEGDWVIGGFREESQPAFVGTGRWTDMFAVLPGTVTVTQAEVAVRDVFNAESVPMTLTIGDAPSVGAACDATTYCALELTCVSDVCAASTESTTVCATATALTITEPTDTTTSTTVSGTIPAGTGALTPGCTNAVGPEVIYTLTVPAAGTGTYDVIADTNLTGTGETDTAIYLRSTCEDPTTELACNDDIDLDGGTYSSRFELLDAPAGDHAIVVEQWFPVATTTPGDFQMEVSLRPVLATGAACDNAGADNRCAAGACAASVCP
ncbi:MAG: hypothetical protein JRH11_04990 [Deltaproteobacteria bacterium]|nr:hypothetical protein [Deltaproteobacteria bacterium]